MKSFVMLSSFAAALLTLLVITLWSRAFPQQPLAAARAQLHFERERMD
jgi:hypothetical protein